MSERTEDLLKERERILTYQQEGMARKHAMYTCVACGKKIWIGKLLISILTSTIIEDALIGLVMSTPISRCVPKNAEK